jgi:hypothetical protein
MNALQIMKLLTKLLDGLSLVVAKQKK